MTKMEDGLSKASLCSRPGFDLEYMFTVNSQVEDPGTKVSRSYESERIVDFSKPPYPDGDYGNCSAYTGYEKAISHTAIAIMKRPGHLWGPVPGQPTQVEEFYPITEEGFSLVPKVKPGEYELKAGPFIFELDGPAYSVMSGMDMKRFAHSTYRKGRVKSFVSTMFIC
jgi:hypothetical protein